MTAATRKKNEARKKETHKTERAHFPPFFFSSCRFFSPLFFVGRKDYVKTMEKQVEREKRKDLD